MTEKIDILTAITVAAQGVVELWKRPGEDELEYFERIATLFHKETGELRPGKDAPDEMLGRPEAERGHFFIAWCQARRDRLWGALARLDGGDDEPTHNDA